MTRPSISLFAVLAFLIGAIHAHSSPAPGSSIKSSGKEYLRLSDWARSNGMKLRPVTRQMVEVSNSSVTFILAGDSREFRMNGVNIWLSLPCVIRDNAFYISKLDLQTTVQPLLSPPKNPSGTELKSICLDPGHGGSDPGKCVGPFQEKKFTLLLAREVRQQLTRAGLNVTMTRSNDASMELPLRPDAARRNNADLFVSLHFNSVESSRTVVRGAEVYCLTPAGASSTNSQGEGANAGPSYGNRNNTKNILLAYQVQKALTKNPLVNDRGVRRARFAVLRSAEMPAVLIEAAYMSHPEEGKRIFDASYRKMLAKTIVDGVLAYKHALEQKG